MAVNRSVILAGVLPAPGILLHPRGFAFADVLA